MKEKEVLKEGVVTFRMDNRDDNGDGIWEELFVIYNAASDSCTVDLPEGRWEILADGREADCCRAMPSAGKGVSIDGKSGMMLGRKGA